MTIREGFDFTFSDHREMVLALEAREDQSLSLKLLSASGQVLGFYPTRAQWFEFRKVLIHILDADDVTASSAVAAKEPVDIAKDIANTRRLWAEAQAKKAPSGISLDQEVPVEMLKVP